MLALGLHGTVLPEFGNCRLTLLCPLPPSVSETQGLIAGLCNMQAVQEALPLREMLLFSVSYASFMCKATRVESNV